ncbi:hypothetical protein BAUCODRAFT_38590 [Baudoinia panamericana UAMH 10762]|uniref:Uncharacterized protein n=1 Tax=Baudoinia panamericana (strain UAMH 10762) TaxID=717646 RepID=M2MMD2_BAUPA|nr:uncharacterized protein BAUCODRAFT_38590 [Baudoinia panamericana UAMH 10762]EMC92523.1 hypothetical protein BAUCODRAFT_38590 [Baudoinia panamericana UAMH 10762]
MATLTSSLARPAISFQCAKVIARTSPSTIRRALSTLPNNPHIYIHPHPTTSKAHLLTYLPTTPPNPHLAIGTTTAIPPTPDSFAENHHFLDLLHTTIATHAPLDPDVQAQAAMYASQAGSYLGSGGAFFPGQQTQRQRQRRQRGQTGRTTKPEYGGGGGAGGDGAGGASAQGGMGGAGRGGYIHVSDQRNPPDFGRVAWPEDIFGSLEVDGEGKFVDGTGRYQKSGTYRIVTREGVLGLSEYLRKRVVERLSELEVQIKRNG